MDKSHFAIKRSSEGSVSNMGEQKMKGNPNFEAADNKPVRHVKYKKRGEMSEQEKEAIRKYDRERKRIQRSRQKERNAVLNVSASEQIQKENPNFRDDKNKLFQTSILKNRRQLKKEMGDMQKNKQEKQPIQGPGKKERNAVHSKSSPYSSIQSYSSAVLRAIKAFPKSAAKRGVVASGMAKNVRQV